MMLMYILLRKQKRILVILLIIFMYNLTTFAYSQFLMVNVNLLNVRSGPSSNFPIIDQVARSTVLTQVEEQGNWAKVVFPNGTRGWVFSTYTTSYYPQNYATVNVPLLNVRRGPGIVHPIVTQFKYLTCIPVLEENNGWLNVLLPEGGQAWIAGWFTKPAEGPIPPVSSYDADLNQYVQEVIKTYNGHFPYLLNNDYANYNGVSENLIFNDRTLAKAHPSGNRATHCSGITFEVFFKAMQARNQKLGLDIDDFNGMTFNELHDFLLIWYVANGNQQTNNIQVAMEKYGIGRSISHLEDAKPGDFAHILRNNGTGHTTVFQNWIRDNNNQIIGIRYWSTQGSTNGIAYNTEHFSARGGNVSKVFIARALPVNQYSSFR